MFKYNLQAMKIAFKHEADFRYSMSMSVSTLLIFVHSLSQILSIFTSEM